MTNPTPLPALLPCPFCGDKRVAIHYEGDPDGFGKFSFVRCHACGAQSSGMFASTGNDCPLHYAEVREAWNRRAESAIAALGSSMPSGEALTVDAIMEQAQVFASAWSLLGGPFDSGDGLETAEREKAELRTMIASLATQPTAAVEPAFHPNVEWASGYNAGRRDANHDAHFEAAAVQGKDRTCVKCGVDCNDPACVCDPAPFDEQPVAAVQGGLTEQDAFEAHGAERKLDMTQHPLHYLFLNEKTYEARQAWKAALKFAALSANAGSQQGEPSEFWQWLPKAYRDSDANTSFTAYNMEVAFEAGRKLSSATPKEASQQGEPVEREHTTSADCWCGPEVDYVDPDTGATVYVHKRPQ